MIHLRLMRKERASCSMYLPSAEGLRAPETSLRQHVRPRGKPRWFFRQAAGPSSSFLDLRSPSRQLARSVWRSQPGLGDVRR